MRPAAGSPGAAHDSRPAAYAEPGRRLAELLFAIRVLNNCRGISASCALHRATSGRALRKALDIGENGGVARDQAELVEDPVRLDPHSTSAAVNCSPSSHGPGVSWAMSVDITVS